MTIQRQYSLPNCKLVLEGLGDETATNGVPGRPPISILTNAECHFTGYDTPITGGRDFLESLVTAVSHYAQEYLSGISHPTAHAAHANKPRLVQFQRLDEHVHRLVVQPDKGGHAQNGHAAAPIQIDLRTVQLFDLVEAIDQFLVDTQTLPDLSLDLQPASRRYVSSGEPLAKRVVPAAIGVSSLAVAAIAFFFVPVPQRVPEPTTRNTTEQSTNTASTTTTSPAATGSTELPETSRNQLTPVASSETPSGSDEVASNSDEDETRSPSANSDEDETRSPSEENGTASPPSSEELSSTLTTSPEITEPEQVSRLTRQLRNQLDEAWTRSPNFNENLVYRVSVADNGDILGFKYGNDAAIENVNQTPLLDLRYNSVESNNSEPLAQFRVVFTPQGVIEVSPWHGRPQESPSPTP